MKNISRRKFIRNTGISMIGVPFVYACSAKEYSLWRFFTNHEAKVLGIICNQIIPEDDFPGAVDAGVIYYIDQRLISKYSELKNKYRKGLKSVEESCQQMHGKSIFELTWEQQTQFLVQMEKNKLAQKFWAKQSSSSFFYLVRKHTIEGYFGHPRHGGNKNLAGYRLVHFEYPELRGQNRYDDARFRNTNWKYVKVWH